MAFPLLQDAELSLQRLVKGDNRYGGYDYLVVAGFLEQDAADASKFARRLSSDQRRRLEEAEKGVTDFGKLLFVHACILDSAKIAVITARLAEERGRLDVVGSAVQYINQFFLPEKSDQVVPAEFQLVPENIGTTWEELASLPKPPRPSRRSRKRKDPFMWLGWLSQASASQ